MTNSSSRVLRDGEHSAVTPIQWRVTVGSSTPNGKSGRSERSVRSGKDGPSEKNAAEGNQIPQQELARIEREAYQRGFAEGQAQGRVQAGAEVQPALDRLAQKPGESYGVAYPDSNRGGRRPSQTGGRDRPPCGASRIDVGSGLHRRIDSRRAGKTTGAGTVQGARAS